MACEIKDCFAPDVACHQGHMKRADCPNWKIKNDREALQLLQRLLDLGYTPDAIIDAYKAQQK